MTAIILRHAEYNHTRLTERGIADSIEKGKEIRELIGDISDTQIAMLTSTAPRAEHTASSIFKGMGIEGGLEIEPSSYLWKDIQHQANLEESLKLILDLPPHAILIVISHLGFVHILAEALGYAGGRLIRDDDNEEHESYLEGYTIEGGIYRKKLTEIREKYTSE